MSSRNFSFTVLNWNFILKEFLFRGFHSRGPSQARDQINNQDQNNNEGYSVHTSTQCPAGIFQVTVLNQNFTLKEFLFRGFHSRGPSRARDQINNQDQNNNKGYSDPTATANTDVDDQWRWNAVASGQQHKWTIKLLQTQYGCS